MKKIKLKYDGQFSILEEIATEYMIIGEKRKTSKLLNEFLRGKKLDLYKEMMHFLICF